jgi:GTP-binding protein Era
MTDNEFSPLPDRDELPPDHRSGFVAVVGKPNVGKSTLMNAFLGEKVAIVTPKPQTTRLRQLGILTLPRAQVIFVDTPGIHQPRTKLGEAMVEAATDALPGADAVLFMVDVSQAPDEADRMIASALGRFSDLPVVLALNKSDLLPPDKVIAHTDAYRALVSQAEWMLVSATRGNNCDELLDMLIAALPEGPRFYPADQLTDMHLRDAAAEIVREKVLLNLRQEVPHAVAVQVDEFKERSEDLTYIGATIYVEKDSQKGILIGQGGGTLRRIGKQSRRDIEEMLGNKVYLDLWVKVLKNWRKDEKALRRLGLLPPKR